MVEEGYSIVDVWDQREDVEEDVLVLMEVGSPCLGGEPENIESEGGGGER